MIGLRGGAVGEVEGGGGGVGTAGEGEGGAVGVIEADGGAGGGGGAAGLGVGRAGPDADLDGGVDGEVAVDEDVAGDAGVSTQYLSEIERGRKEPSSEVIEAVGGALGLRLVDLTTRVSRRLAATQPRGPLALAA